MDILIKAIEGSKVIIDARIEIEPKNIIQQFENGYLKVSNKFLNQLRNVYKVETDF